MNHKDDADGWAARLTAKLAPEAVRSTLAFAGLYQLVHEMIKSSVLDDLKSFYGHNPLAAGSWFWGDERYRTEVLALAPKREFRASLLWLEQAGALTAEQRERLNVVYEYRHRIAHELAQFIVDADLSVDIKLLTDAVAILRHVSRFWTQMEIDMGSFGAHGEVTVDDAHPGRMLVLDLCLASFLEQWPQRDK